MCLLQFHESSWHLLLVDFISIIPHLLQIRKQNAAAPIQQVQQHFSDLNGFRFALFSQIHIPHSVPYFQHERRRNGKFVNAHSQECFRQRGIRRQFAADTDPRTVGVGILGTHFDEPQNRLVVGVDKRFDVWILPVAGKGVLGQIIRANTEKVHHGCQTVADNGSCRRFDHDAQFHGVGIGHTLLPQGAVCRKPADQGKDGP